MGTSAAKLHPGRALSSLGLDYLMAVELRIRISSDLGVDVPVMNLLQSESIAELALHVAEQVP